MKILVTGAAGFIGSHLCEKLLEIGYDIIGVDNFDPFYPKQTKEKNIEKALAHPNFCFFQLNIEDEKSLEQLKGQDIKCIIHLAAKAGVLPSLKDPKKYLQTNIVGTQNLLELMKVEGIQKFIFASSSSVYGNNEHIPFSEADHVDNPISPYAFSKKSCELLNYTYHHLYEIDVVNLRFFTVYGPRQRPDLAIHKFVSMITRDEVIPVYGDGSSARDYTFINDTIAGICQSLDYILNGGNIYETFNLGNNNPIKLIDLVHTIYQVMGKETKINFLPMQPGDVAITYADISKAGAKLNYHPKTSLTEGLTEFYKWFLLDKKNLTD